MAARADSMADELLPYVRPFVGSSGGGQWSFQVLCSVRACRRQDTVSAARHTVGSERHRRRSCEALARQGWAAGPGGPVCPNCRSAIAESGAAAGRRHSG